uniref:Histidine decarboxylase n=1 Tax=Solanum tuberosum TaxID=4113 RepID=M1BRW9_SOLTU
MRHEGSVWYDGYPLNLYYEHHAALAPLLQFHLNNFGDPFTQHPTDFHSKDFEVAVLDWFAQLWEIEKDEYWGYITSGGTEGNLHGLLVGLSMKGHAGLQKDAKMCYENARYLKDRLHKAEISAMLNELSNIVVFERPCDDKFIRRWQLSCTRDTAHVVVMPGTTKEIIDNFFKDLMQEREKWCGITLAPCLADDIASQNCLCSYHNMHH